MRQTIPTTEAMRTLGAQIGELCSGGEVIELIGDIGAGKTTFTKGLAEGLGIDEEVQSPTFTISRVYQTEQNIVLAHYDFYRLSDPGIMRDELAESVNDPRTVTVVEWAAAVEDVLPKDTLKVSFGTLMDEHREVTLSAGGEKSEALVKGIV